MTEMLTYLKKGTEEEKIASIIETYGYGFDDIYRDGKYEGKLEGKLETAKNMLNEGLDEKTIARYTKLPTNKIKELKRNLNTS